MKYAGISCLLWLFSGAFRAQAQLPSKPVWGIGGYGFLGTSAMWGHTAFGPVKRAFSMMGGGVAERKLSNHLVLQLQAGYALRNVERHVGQIAHRYTLHYMRGGPLAKLYLQSEGGWFLTLGVNVAVLRKISFNKILHDPTKGPADEDNPEEDSNDIKNYFSSFDVMLCGGGGYDFQNGFNITLLGSQGLLNLNKEVSAMTQSAYNFQIGLVLSYTLRL